MFRHTHLGQRLPGRVRSTPRGAVYRLERSWTFVRGHRGHFLGLSFAEVDGLEIVVAKEDAVFTVCLTGPQGDGFSYEGTADGAGFAF